MGCIGQPYIPCTKDVRIKDGIVLSSLHMPPCVTRKSLNHES